jgi:hypothetical protein
VTAAQQASKHCQVIETHLFEIAEESLALKCIVEYQSVIRINIA